MDDRQTATLDPSPGPVSAAERITSLDAIRGIALLGILPMNAVVDLVARPTPQRSVRVGMAMRHVPQHPTTATSASSGNGAAIAGGLRQTAHNGSATTRLPPARR